MSFATRLWRSPTLRGWAGFEETIWSRKVADQEVRKLVAPLGPSALSALEISGQVWQGFGFRSYKSTSFPAFDICAGALDEQFDLVIAEHVFEHVLWPYRAARHALQMTKPDGHLLVTAPFLYRIHPNPEDCSRWTEAGLKHLLAECGFDIEGIQTGSWGNRVAVRAHLDNEFILFNRHLHSLVNEPDCPMVVWALARRGA